MSKNPKGLYTERFSESSGPLFKSSCHFSLKNHFLLCMESCFCYIHNLMFLLGQPNSLGKCSVKKEGVRGVGSQTGVGWSICEQLSVRVARNDPAPFSSILFSFHPPPCNHMHTTHTHAPGRAQACVRAQRKSI